jgi:putative IMPACT (imprinted ancient) family translation regulator
MSVLDKAKIVEKVLMEELTIKFPYDFTSQVMHTISKFEAKVIDTTYEEDVKMMLNVRQAMINNFKMELFDLCRGNVEI